MAAQPQQTSMPVLATLNRSINPSFRSVAPEELAWAREKEFFRIQVTKHWQIRQSLEKQVPATIESVRQAALECAAMGLTMSHNSQFVYFIPRRERKQWRDESKADYERNVPWLVHATPSYRGLAYICTHYGGAELVAAEVVFEADEFKYFGPLKDVEHVPTLDNKLRTESKAIGAYCTIIMQNGRVRSEYMDAPTIAKVRAKSDNKNGLMWTTFWTEGWRKAVIRRLAKLVMNTEPRLLAATEVLNRHEGIVIDQDGNDVSRGTHTPEFENVPPAEDQTKGMTGLGNALNRRRASQGAQDDEIELPPVQPDVPDPDIAPESASEPESDEFGPAEDTNHPAESIEWWAEKIAAAGNLHELDRIRAEMLHRGADQSDDADQLREIYAARSRALKQEAAS